MPVKERLATLFILVGPGGVGKNALMAEILKLSDKLKQLATATTRSPRAGEKDGIHHLFVTEPEFRQMIKDNELLEYQEVHPGKFYGVPRSMIDKAIENRQDLIADIEFKGAAIIQDEYSDNSVSIFIAPPSVDALEQRMIDRKDNSKDIQDRLNRMSVEMLYAPNCDYVIVNDHFDTALAELSDVIRLERGEASMMNVTLHDVSYQAHIVLRCGEYHKQLACTIPQGNLPMDVILQFIADQTDQQTNQSSLSYAHPNGNLPVEILLSERQYKITYHFIYDFPVMFDAPDGWEWMS